MDSKTKPTTSNGNTGLTITTGSKRIAERAAAAAAAAAKTEPEDSSSSSTSAAKKRALPSLPVTKSTRPTRAVKNARKIYSPPTTPVPSPSSNKRITRPSNRVKAPPPVVIPKTGKESMIKSNKDYFKQTLGTIEGQTKLIRRANQDPKFGRFLIDSLNQHVNKVAENVRTKRTKAKGKMTKSMQLAEMKNSKRIDLNSPESILTSINLSTIINRDNFNKLPSFYQYKLTKMLPKCDQLSMANGVIVPTSSAFNNEFFSRALASFSYRLTEGRLTNETLARLKREMEREKKNLDPFKVKHFEPFFKDPELTPEAVEGEYKHNLKFLSMMSIFYNGVKLFLDKREQFPPSIRPSVHFDEHVIRSSGHKQMIEPLNDTILKVAQAANSTATGKSTSRVNRSSDFPPLIIGREKKNDLQVEVLDCYEQAQFDACIQLLDAPVPVKEEEMNLQVTETLDTFPIDTKPIYEPSNHFQINNLNLELLQAQQNSYLPQSSVTNSKPCQTPSASVGTANVSSIPAVVKPKSTKVTKPRAPRKPKPPKVTVIKKEIVDQSIGAQSQPTRTAFSPNKADILSSLEKQLTPQTIIRHLPSTSRLNTGTIVDWNNYTQSIYYINSFLQKFLEQLQLYTNKFDKLQLATKVLFSPLEILCNGCVRFLIELRKNPKHKTLPVLLNHQFTFDIPDEIKTRLELISNLSEDRMGSFCSGGSWESDSYFNQINLNIIERMLTMGRKLVQHDFNAIIQHFTRREPIAMKEHIEYIRQAITYVSFCKSAVSLLAKPSTNQNQNEADANEPLNHLRSTSLYGTNEPVMA